MAETIPATWLTRTGLRARGWSKTMCRAMLPEPEDTIGRPRHRMVLWSLAMVQQVENLDEVQA